MNRLGPARVFEDGWREDNEGLIKMHPVPKLSDLSAPHLELNLEPRKWNYYTRYVARAPDVARSAPTALVREATDFFAAVLVAAIELAPNSEQAYPTAERSKVRKHLVRERSAALASAAKLRDGYTCQVCGINFGVLYGPRGHGVAEAHHRIALSSPLARKQTRVEDLVTVCANCHRMLHRLSPDRDGVPELRRLLTRRWPAGPRTAA